MFPVSSAANGAVRPVQPVEQASALRSSQQNAAETTRASSGEASAANIRTESAQAVKAAEQAAVVARLRDQERAEEFARAAPSADAPAGPPPAFEESPLERQARLAFEPPESSGPIETPTAAEPVAPPPEPEAQDATPRQEVEDTDPPPTPRERAETSFAETRTLAAPKEPATVDVGI